MRRRIAALLKRFLKRPSPEITVDLPLNVAIRSGRHLLIRGPDPEAETAKAQAVVVEWMRQRDGWHARMDAAGKDLAEFTITQDGQPLRKGVYAFRDGPFALTPGVRRLRGVASIPENRAGILAVGLVEAPHFAIAAHCGWTLVGCAGGGAQDIQEIIVVGMEDVLRIRAGGA